MTIRSQVLEYLIENPYRHLTLDRIDADLGHLTRRQIITALHGLRDGLEDQLTRTGGGAWLYTPPPQVKTAVDPDISYMPVGWTQRIRVVLRVGDLYMLRVVDDHERDTKTRLWARIIEGPIEWLVPSDRPEVPDQRYMEP